MDLQAIGVLLASQSKTCGVAPADEDQFYKDLAWGKHITMVIELASHGLKLGLSGLSRVNPKRRHKRWTSTANDTATE